VKSGLLLQGKDEEIFENTVLMKIFESKRDEKKKHKD
jgi:hypothetical protein